MLHMILLPLLAITGGAVGFCLRQWELTCSFDEAGLSSFDTPATILLMILSVVLSAVFLVLCLRHRKRQIPLGDAFLSPNHRPYLIFVILAALLLLVAGAMGLAEELTCFSPDTLSLVFWSMCILTCISVSLIARRNFSARNQRRCLAMAVPPFTCCFWLIVICQPRAADPVILDYAYELFAVICTLLALYFSASLSFVRTRVWPCILFHLLGLYFCMVTLADARHISMQLVFIFALIYQLVHVTVLLRRTFPTTKKKNSGGLPHE